MPRISRAALCVLVLAIVALFYVSRLAYSYENLFFAGPIVDATVAIDNKDRSSLLYFTYETAAMNLEYTLISTNYAYGRVLGYNMRSGSFFTQNAQEELRKNVVLNEKLAFDTFGGFDIEGVTFNINNEPYTVTGVIDDGQEEKNAYIPGATATSFMAVIDTEEKVIADLQNIGVRENRFHMVNLSEVAKSVQNKPWLALMCLGIIVLGLLLYRTIRSIYNLTLTLRRMNQDEYLNTLMKSKEARKWAGLLLAAAAETAALLWLFLHSAEMALQWAKFAGSLHDVTSLAFGGKVRDLQNLCLFSNIFLGIFCGGVLLGFIGVKRDKQSV